VAGGAHCRDGRRPRCAASPGTARRALSFFLSFVAHTEFWALGHRLFCSTDASTGIKFITGDILDSTHLSAAGPPAPTLSTAEPNDQQELDQDVGLPALTTLNALRRRVSAIHAGAVFHLFSAVDQARLARALATLLAPHAGAALFGWSAASPRAHATTVRLAAGVSHRALWCHSPASWRALWEDDVFGGAGGVEVRAEVCDFEDEIGMMLVDGSTPRKLVWSVRRV
jgi:hypothetical protein